MAKTHQSEMAKVLKDLDEQKKISDINLQYITKQDVENQELKRQIASKSAAGN